VSRAAAKRRVSVLARARVAAYADPGRDWLRAVPPALARRWRLQPPPEGQRRIEVGSGFWPHEGYVHVDVFPDATDVDVLAPGDELPFPDAWADELLSVHMLEHVPPPRLTSTLREWARVLRPGGKIVIHTPNGEALAAALLHAGGASSRRLWAVQNAVYGYWLGPADVGTAAQFVTAPDHKVLLTLPLLRDLLAEAGFEEVEDVTGRDPCHHRDDWADLVPGLCLEVEARAPGVSAGPASAAR
jgi:predicted SAM-dependent methyltransferase